MVREAAAAGNSTEQTLLLLPQHREDLRKSGLSDETIRACRFGSVQGKEASRLLNWKGGGENLGPCLCIPFLDREGRNPDSFARLRPDHPRPDTKYEQPKSRLIRPYFPPMAWPLLDNPGLPLVLTEGEKKACKAAQEGLACVGLTGVECWGVRDKPEPGQEKGKRLLHPQLNALHLKGRAVYIVFDSDAAEKTEVQWAEYSLALALREAGAMAKVVRLPGSSGDGKVGLDDFLCQHPVADLRHLMDRAIEPSQPPPSREKSSGRSEQATGTSGQAPRRLCLICAADVEMRPTEWLVPEFIARGGLNVIGGDGGFGKSSLTIHLAAQLSQGEPCFGLNYQTKGPTRTLLIGCEDSRSATVVPRLAAAGAVLKNINFVDDILVGETDRVSFVLSPSGLEALEQAIIKLGDVSCVVIDPVSAFLADKIDDHKDSDVRRMLRPLAELAERLNIAIVLVKHLNKSDSGNSGNLVSGSRAYVNASRAAFLVGQDPSDDADEDRRVLVFSKRNLTKRWKGLAFRAVPLDEDQAAVVLIMPQAAGFSDEDREALRGQLFRLEWLGETDATDSDLAKARRGKDNAGGRNKRIAECGEWLLQFLADGRKRLSDDVKSAAISAGFSDKILFDAKKANSAIRASNKGEARGKWYWWFEEKRPPGSTPFTGTAT